MPSGDHRPALPPQFPDDLRTDAPLGCIAGRENTVFRLFAPRATAVTLVLFERFDMEKGEEYSMSPGPGGTWEHTVGADLTGRWYGYRIDGPRGRGEMFDPSVLVADPYSRAVTTQNTWRLPAKTLISDTSYDWGDDRSPLVEDHSGLVIYECHVRDMTAHPSARARKPGTYAGLAEKGIDGGLGHILSLGVNAVELMPVMKFGTMEIPYRDDSARTDSGKVNDWNPYARNHWGYMTSFFFAPETWYGTDGTMAPGAVNGADGRAVRELKDLVKALHRHHIAVILDVVYNHTSHYDFNPFKYVDKQYYYRCDASGNFLEASGCGNDFATERPMARRVILDSVRYWLEEYRVDGFRFDLAGMLDEETCRQATSVARRIRPDAVLIAEPWGGGRHHPEWFRELGWWSWNDGFRDLIKGRDPHHGRGFIFGAGGNPVSAVHTPGATPDREEDRPLLHRWALNYLESHDGYTLGDFIRLATGEVSPDERVPSPGIEGKTAGTALSRETGGAAAGPGPTAGRTDDVRRLSPRQLGLNKFAALILFCSPGPVMLHQGQEFARSKVIVPADAPDPDTGKLDHNSYNKDNDTNYLDFGLREVNRELFDYYRGLIGVRRRHPLLSSPQAPRSVETPGGEGKAVIVRIGPGNVPPETGLAGRTGKRGLARGEFNHYIVLLNPAEDRPVTAGLPPGKWVVLANASGVSPAGKEPSVAGTIELPPSSGFVAGGGS